MNSRILFALLFLAFPVVMHADVLLKTTQTWEGAQLVYPEGQAEVTSIKLLLPQGQVSPFHCHPVPTFGYVVKGTIEVETIDGKKTLIREGESAVEVFRTVHRGKAVDGDVEIVVFYAGAVGVPTTVLPENDVNHAHCNPPSKRSSALK